MVILRRLRRRKGLLLFLFSLNDRHDLSYPRDAFHVPKLLLAVQEHRPQPTLKHRTPSGAFDIPLAVPDQ
ncbi:MAG: hypothetical protein ABI618_16115 [Nitrospirota bacterium]